MNWDDLCTRLEKDGLFDNLQSLSLADRMELLQLAPFLKTSVLTDEVMRGRARPWFESAIYNNAVSIKPLLRLLLQRHLLNIGTRRNPGPLCEYWEWVVSAAELSDQREIFSLWRDREGSLRECCKEGDLKAIANQEQLYAQLLTDAATVLKSCKRTVLDWAHDLVQQLAERMRPPSAHTPKPEAIVRVAFVWEDPSPRMRPGLLVDLKLEATGALDPIIPDKYFAEDFQATVKLIHKKLKGRFRQLVFQNPWTPQSLTSDKSFSLPEGRLKGQSGGLAILVSQILSDTPDSYWRPKHAYTLPPWIIATAAIRGDQIIPVEAIGAKVALLHEEGVRQVIIADETEHLTLVRSLAAATGMSVHSERSARKLATTIISSGCAWPVEFVPNVDFVRRGLVAAGLVAVAASIGLGYSAFREKHPKTEAMRHHILDELRDRANEIRGFFGREGATREAYFTEKLKARQRDNPLQLTASEDVKVLSDSKLYDSSDWASVETKQDIKSKPIEFAHFTRVIWLQKLNPKTEIFVAEFNTGGFAVFPYLTQDHEDWTVSYRPKWMKEMPIEKQLNPPLTTYLEIPIGDLGNDGKPFRLVMHAHYINGTQDQRFGGKDSEGKTVKHDWWGTRVAPGTEHADLSVILPSNREFNYVKRFLRKESTATEVLPADPLYGPGGEADGTYTDGPTTVWFIPCDPLIEREVNWIYSIQWQWKDK